MVQIPVAEEIPSEQTIVPAGVVSKRFEIAFQRNLIPTQGGQFGSRHRVQTVSVAVGRNLATA
jgi:hypothetical protein